MSTITVIVGKAVALLTSLISICYSQNDRISGIKLLGVQDQALMENSDTVHYSMVSKIECTLQCAAVMTCCGISYREASLECSLSLSSKCFTVHEVGSVFMRIQSIWTVTIDCSDCLVFGSSSYKISSTVANWETSRVNCINLGGKLVEIETQEENEFLKSSLDKASSYWIGGYDLAWLSKPNEALIFTDWGDIHEPDHPTNQRCLIMWNDYNLKWGTYVCSLEFISVCEFV